MKNNETNKIEFFKENKRVKIVTEKGKFFGKIKFIDNETIQLRKETIKIDSIVNIKSHSTSNTVLSCVMVYAGAFTFAFIPLVALGGAAAGETIALLCSGTAVITTGLLLPNFTKNHKSKLWTYKIVTVE